jgi:hypothetical protein
MKKLAFLLGIAFLAATALAQTELSLPEGTSVKAKLQNTLSTFSSKPGDPFTARVTEAVTLDGKTVIPVGATVQGRVTKVSEPRRIAGKPTIGIFRRPVQRFRPRPQGLGGGWRGHRRRDANRWIDRRPCGHGDRGRRRRRRHHGSLAGASPLGHAAGGHGTVPGTEPPDADFDGRRRAIEAAVFVK